MSRRMMFVLAVSALAGLGIAFMLGERHAAEPVGAAQTPAGDPAANPADDMAKAIRKAIEGGK